MLGVTAENVVSAECAMQMAEGARRVLGADVGLAVTGVAGPTEQEGQPVGTVFFGLAMPGREPGGGPRPAARRPAPDPPVLHDLAAEPGPPPPARPAGHGDPLNGAGRAAARPEIGRAFVAVRPPDAVLDAVADAVRPARAVADGLRWELRERWHLTLQFLGPLARLAPVADGLAAVVGARPPSRSASAVPAPSRHPGRARVVWIGAAGGGDALVGAGRRPSRRPCGRWGSRPTGRCTPTSRWPG